MKQPVQQMRATRDGNKLKCKIIINNKDDAKEL